MDSSGESIVTCIALTPIFLSLILHRLIYEFVGLSFLSVAALLVEFTVSNGDNLKIFNPRADTSAGILMGAVCVPSVLVGHVVRQKRMTYAWMDSNDLEDFRSEFWSALVSSVSLLVYIVVTMSYRKLFIPNKGDNKIWTVLFVLIPSLAILLIMKLPKVAFLVFVSTWLLNYIVKVFPCCTSLGEAVLVSNGLALYSSYAVARMFDKIAAAGPPISQETTVSGILQGILIGLLCIPWMYKLFGVGFTWLLGFYGFHQTKVAAKLCNAVSFYLAMCLAFVIITAGWLHFVQGLDKFLLTWVVEFVLQDMQRLYLCGYWVCVISMSVLPFYMVKSTKFEQIMVRKVFHLMVVVMFVPALLAQQAFLHLAFSAALAVFVVVEMIRILRIPPAGEAVHKFMTAFTDTRDSDLLIISHFSLLLGCALPLWLSGSSTHDRPLAPFAGVLSLGIGDTMASVAGYNFGSIRLTPSSKKTVEGTIAGIVSLLLACIIINCMLLQFSLTMTEWTSLFLAVICTSLVEAYTTQLDNFILPLIFYALLLV
ncbi:hypothetical protein GOP47_0003503 [Adiantum capillus-veneris]|uniref:dolichol kinase n=1 Tax=Adiantum capillus-veneris TaxID=13818 RepID=A0A9D4VC33_ADICA|nr:hypothetical protein GOP47_0003028 [Adiantum capillus-veneris]KAI5083760.1 hypothetical protein GOP47_0003503 [Adiantum capillus-veneris]